MTDEEWVKAAMTDDLAVAELLMRLNHQPKSPPIMKVDGTPALSLEWTVRQPRSKPPVLRIVGEQKKGESSRASPTTPLSWSGATSVSGGGGGGGAADGFEESSRLVKVSDGARSKVIATSETTTTKRSRKKKTLPELREQESLLLKERKRLRNELATLRITVEKERAANESLKRMKFDVQEQLAAKPLASNCVASEETKSDQHQQLEATCDPPMILGSETSVACNDPSTSSPNGYFKLQKDAIVEDTFSGLPDLNLPCEEVSGSGVSCGVS